MSINLSINSDIETRVIDLIQRVMQTLDYEIEDPIVDETALVADLGFASLDFVQLIVETEATFGQKMGFQDLLIQEGKYITDIQVRELVTFIQKQLAVVPTHVSNGETTRLLEVKEPVTVMPVGMSSPPLIEQSTKPLDRLTSETVLKFRQTIRPRAHRPVVAKKQLNQTIFVLCPPRSGSTLLRVILAGHPQLFSPPELYLLMYNDLAQRRQELAGAANNHLLEGTIRALMELKNLSADQAEALMAEYEQQAMDTQSFYGILQDLMGDRRLVDKTPLYPLDLGILQRAEAEFTNPLYIHLVRHPYATIQSYEESKLDRFVPVLYDHPFARRELAELTWLVSHQNITHFLTTVPQDRWVQLRFEDLVTQPEASVANLCQFLNLSFCPAMLQPYSNPSQRMLSGARQLTRMPGDLKFHLHKDIDANNANRWQQFVTSDFLGDVTWQLAESLGYRAAEVRNLVPVG